MWLAQFFCAPQFFKTPSGLCGQTVLFKTNLREENCSEQNALLATSSDRIM
jgi:hypothetical protein